MSQVHDKYSFMEAPMTHPHLTALFRVPALDLLAWVPGAGNAVYLIHP